MPRVEALVWWVVLFGVWLATLSTFPPAELVAGAVSALPCAVAAVAGRRAVDGAWRVRPRWLRWLLPLPVAVVTEAARLLLLPLGRRVRAGPVGHIREIALTPQSDGTVAEAHRALATTVLAATPGSVVVDTRPDDDVLVVHAIVGELASPPSNAAAGANAPDERKRGGLVSGRPRMDEVVRT